MSMCSVWGIPREIYRHDFTLKIVICSTPNCLHDEIQHGKAPLPVYTQCADADGAKTAVFLKPPGAAG